MLIITVHVSFGLQSKKSTYKFSVFVQSACGVCFHNGVIVVGPYLKCVISQTLSRCMILLYGSVYLVFSKGGGHFSSSQL